MQYEQFKLRIMSIKAKYGKTGNLNQKFYDEIHNFASKELPGRRYSDYIATMLFEYIAAYEQLFRKHESQNFSKTGKSDSRLLKSSTNFVQDIASNFFPQYGSPQTLEQNSFTKEEQIELVEQCIKLKQELENAQQERDELDKRVNELLVTISKYEYDKSKAVTSLETFAVIQNYKYFKDQRLTSVSKQVFEIIKQMLPQEFDAKFVLATVKSLLSEYTLQRMTQKELMKRAQTKTEELNKYLQSLIIDQNVLNQVSQILENISHILVVKGEEPTFDTSGPAVKEAQAESYENKHRNDDCSTEDEDKISEEQLPLLPKENNELECRTNNLTNDDTRAPNGATETTLEQNSVHATLEGVRKNPDESNENMASVTPKSTASIDEDLSADRSPLKSSELTNSEVSSLPIKDDTDYDTVTKVAIPSLYTDDSQVILSKILSTLNLVYMINFPDEIRYVLNELTKEGQQLVKDIMDTDPPGLLWSDNIGSSFDSEKHEPLRGYDEHGTIVLTVTPGYKIGQSIQVKALVITG